MKFGGYRAPWKNGCIDPPEMTAPPPLSPLLPPDWLGDPPGSAPGGVELLPLPRQSRWQNVESRGRYWLGDDHHPACPLGGRLADHARHQDADPSRRGTRIAPQAVRPRPATQSLGRRVVVAMERRRPAARAYRTGRTPCFRPSAWGPAAGASSPSRADSRQNPSKPAGVTMIKALASAADRLAYEWGTWRGPKM